MQRPSKNLFIINLITIVLLTIVFLWLLPGSPQSLLGALKPNGQTLRIGYAIEPPYAYIDDQQRVTGESPESARHIASMLGIDDLEWVQLPFAELIPALHDRQIDLIAAGFFITRDRQQSVRFTVPTLKVYPGLLVSADSSTDFSSDFANNLSPDQRFLTIEGSVEAAKLSQMQPPISNVLVNDLQAAITHLSHHDNDALLLSLPTLNMLAAENPNFRVIDLDMDASRRLSADYVAFAFNRDAVDLFNAWNRATQQWVGSDQHIDTIRPFGFNRQDIAVPDIR